jgi:hypothetical protein
MIEFAYSIVAGTVLVIDRVQSPNYVTGVSGWAIFQNGTVEFNNAVIRGSLSAGGGHVVVDAAGVRVTDGTSVIYQINTTGGFLAQRIPDDGSFASMSGSGNGNSNGGVTFYEPTSPSTINNITWTAGYVGAFYNTAGATDTPYLVLVSPCDVAGPLQTGQIQLYGQSSTSAVDNSRVNLDAANTTINGAVLITLNGGARPNDSFDNSVTNGTTASATFVDSLTTTGVIGVSFVAPQSGGVWVLVQAGGFNPTALATLSLDFNIRNGSTIGSGSIFRAADINSCGEHQSAVANHIGHMMSQGYVAGLTPGSSYNATMAYATTSGTGNFRRRKITVSPNIINF